MSRSRRAEKVIAVVNRFLSTWVEDERWFNNPVAVAYPRKASTCPGCWRPERRVA
jgi:hypothetical protein